MYNSISQGCIGDYNYIYETTICHDKDFNYTAKSNQPVINFENNDMSGTITYNFNKALYHIRGVLKSRDSSVTMGYYAAAPLHRNYSYSGSALPFATPEMAYENSPNKGQGVIGVDGIFAFDLWEPSAFYVVRGKILMRPHVHIHLSDRDKVYHMELNEPVPNRSLTSLPDRPNRTEPR